MIRILAATIALITLTACEPTQEEIDRKAVGAQQAQYGVAQPIPSFDWSLERDIVAQLYHARNERVTTHTVWRANSGMIEGDCPSIGYPLPYDTSLTNPLQVGWSSSQGGAGVIEQAEPNGIFASKNSTATWVRCVTEVNGTLVEAPVYVESKVTTWAFPVEVNYETNRAIPVSGATPSVTIKAKK